MICGRKPMIHMIMVLPAYFQRSAFDRILM